MSRKSLAARTAGLTLATALGLGVAGPAASAATAGSTHAPAAVQRAGAPAATSIPQSAPLTPVQQAELQRALAAAKPPAWLTKVLNALKKSPATFKALKLAAKKGYPTFRKVWVKVVPKSIQRFVGTGHKLRLVYLAFRALPRF